MSGMFNFDVFDGALDIGGLVSSASPFLSGFSALGGVFGGSKVRISGSMSDAQTGGGLFNPSNKMKKNSGFDLTEPQNIMIGAALVVGAAYLVAKVK